MMSKSWQKIDLNEELGELSLTPLSKTNSLQDVSVLLDCIPSQSREKILSLANGEVRRIKVVAITPSTVVLMVYNSHDTTAPTRTLLTTIRATYIAFVITATIVGTLRTIPTTTPTGR